MGDEDIEITENNEETSKNQPNKQWPQWLATLSVSLSLFNVGMLFSWSSPTIIILTSPSTPIDVNWDEIALIVSCMQLGSGFGPIPGAMITKYYGPKICVLISGLLYLIGYILIICATNATLLITSRIISGVAVGFSFAAVPIYISEIAEKHIRGSLMLMFTIALGCGSIFVSVIAPYVSISVMAEMMLVIPILLIITFSFAPESPYFYIRSNEEDKAYDSIRRLRRQTDDMIINAEIKNIKASTSTDMNLERAFRDFFRIPNPKAFTIVCLIITTQQFCGAVPSLFYQTLLYLEAGVPFDPNFGAMFTSLIAIFFTLFVLPLTDKWGRKPLLHISTLGCIGSDILIGIYYLLAESTDEKLSALYVLPILAFNIMQISFSVGLGPMPYTVAGEVFSSNVKEIGICMVSIFGAVLGFCITRFFSPLIFYIGVGRTYFGMAAVTFVLWLCILFFVPETKSKEFHEIQYILKTKTTFIPCSKRKNNKQIQLNT